jgi:hypothetical protein
MTTKSMENWLSVKSNMSSSEFKIGKKGRYSNVELSGGKYIFSDFPEKTSPKCVYNQVGTRVMVLQPYALGAKCKQPRHRLYLDASLQKYTTKKMKNSGIKPNTLNQSYEMN